MKRKKRMVLGVIMAGLGLFLITGLDSRLTLQNYTVASEKLTSPVRILFLSDLHSCNYGEGQGKLLELALAQEPDLILLGGDWVDDDFENMPPERAYEAASILAKYAPTFYVTGNHEIWSGYGDEIKEQIAACGVKVLSGESVLIDLGGQALRLCGLDDPAIGEAEWSAQLAESKRGTDGETFSILLTHRPERVWEYDGFDLVLAGHAHGGQWRIPGLLNGLLAPNQGLFPAYAGGSYSLGNGGRMIVGRGLSRESTRIPRFYNRPEMVVVDLVPLNP